MRDVTPHENAPEESAKRTQFDVLTPALKQKAALIPQVIFEMKPADLEELVNPTTLMRRLKKKFWMEYHRAIGLGRAEVEVLSIHSGLCSRQYFYKCIVDKQETFAWILSPLNEYDLMTEEALEFAVDRIREEILTVPLYNVKDDGSRGAFLKDNAAALLTAAKFLDARVKGTPLQRIQQANLHVHQGSTGAKSGITREELDRELMEIHARLSGSNLPAIVVPDDVE